MSEERFFSHVKEQFLDYSPEVPQSVYGGMRRKLWWTNFTTFKAFRFNMWYLVLLAGGSSAAVLVGQSNGSSAPAEKAGTFQNQLWQPEILNASENEFIPASSSSCTSENSKSKTHSSCCSASHASESVHCEFPLTSTEGDLPVFESPAQVLPIVVQTNEPEVLIPIVEIATPETLAKSEKGTRKLEVDQLLSKDKRDKKK
ncbi:MAG: hypothetical protein SGI87_13130 [Flavobacteriales bacterium]|nr:hypothetical protein [Flavobacteriales bacterium]